MADHHHQPVWIEWVDRARGNRHQSPISLCILVIVAALVGNPYHGRSRLDLYWLLHLVSSYLGQVVSHCLFQDLMRRQPIAPLFPELSKASVDELWKRATPREDGIKPLGIVSVHPYRSSYGLARQVLLPLELVEVTELLLPTKGGGHR